MAQSVLIGTARFSRDQYSMSASARSRYDGARIPRQARVVGFLWKRNLT